MVAPNASYMTPPSHLTRTGLLLNSNATCLLSDSESDQPHLRPGLDLKVFSALFALFAMDTAYPTSRGPPGWFHASASDGRDRRTKYEGARTDGLNDSVTVDDQQSSKYTVKCRANDYSSHSPPTAVIDANSSEIPPRETRRTDVPVPARRVLGPPNVHVHVEERQRRRAPEARDPLLERRLCRVIQLRYYLSDLEGET